MFRQVGEKLIFLLAGSLVLVLIFSQISLLTYRTMTTVQEEDAVVSNVLGRQRMLSQRIALLTSEYANGSLQSGQELANVVDDFELAHIALTEGGSVTNLNEAADSVQLSGTLSPEISALFFQQPNSIDLQVVRYIEVVRDLLAQETANISLNNPDVQYILDNDTALLESLDSATYLHQLDSQNRVGELQRRALFTFFTTLAILVVGPFFLFRPLVLRSVSRAEAIEAANHVLVEQNEHISEQARDMALAAQLGQRIAQLDDLDTMLTDAVELIRARFNLYHVQIYLLEDHGQSLVLRAATGLAGKSLIQQQFRLSVNPGSINGATIIERHPTTVSDTLSSPIFRPNAFLPETRSEMVLPLISDNQVMGTLDLQDNKLNSLSAEKLSVFETLAGQIAVAVQNGRLYDDLLLAKQQVETATLSQTQSQWGDFLDGVLNPRTIAASYDSDKVKVALANQQSLAIPIKVGGAEIGELEVVVDEKRPLSLEQKSTVEAIAKQVGQRLENLRLLAEAERYRQEAETAARRLTRAGWDEYQSQLHVAGYDFDLQRVQSLDKTAFDELAISQTLKVRGETVGHLEMLSAESQDNNYREMVRAIADQLSSHIENLRLTQQTEIALSETEAYVQSLALLNEMSSEMNRAETVDEVIQIAVKRVPEIVKADRVTVHLVDMAEPDTLIIVGIHGEADGWPAGLRMPITETPMENVIKTKTLARGHFVGESGAELQACFVPLVAAGEAIGTINVAKVGVISLRSEQLLQQAAIVMGSSIEEKRLLAQAQARAEREHRVRAITDKIRRGTDQETILRIAQEEIGKMLGSTHTVAALGTAEQFNRANGDKKNGA